MDSTILTQRNPDFEEQIARITDGGKNKDYRVGILPGLFKHQP